MIHFILNTLISKHIHLPLNVYKYPFPYNIFPWGTEILVWIAKKKWRIIVYLHCLAKFVELLDVLVLPSRDHRAFNRPTSQWIQLEKWKWVTWTSIFINENLSLFFFGSLNTHTDDNELTFTYTKCKLSRRCRCVLRVLGKIAFPPNLVSIFSATSDNV